MANITLKGNPVTTCGDLPAVGSSAPDFSLSASDLSLVNRSNFAGKKIVMNVFPSIDTPVCATSVKKFNEQAASLDNTVVLCISRDLPFAHKRFCGTEELENVVPLSMYRSNEFGTSYGVEMSDGPLEGLFARAIIVLDQDGKVLHNELVGEIADEPNYEAALKSLG